MWKLAQTAEETNSRPSRLLCIDDELAAYQFDCAVTTFRIIVKNALLETNEIGSDKHKKRVPKYKLRDLLDDKFKLPLEDEGQGDLGMIKGNMDGGFYDEV